MTDPYKILGVSSTATDDEIKDAYRALVRKYHPINTPIPILPRWQPKK